MKCKEVLVLLSSYLDEEVGAEEKMRIQEHLKACEACSTTLADLRETVGLLKETQEVLVTPELADKIKNAIREEERSRTQYCVAEAGQERTLAKRSRYLLVFCGVLALALAVMIPMRAFWLQQIAIKEGPETEKSLSVEDKVPARSQEESSAATGAGSFDSLPAGKKVKKTSVNYDKEGVKKVVGFYWEREKGSANSEVFSPERRDENIAGMSDEATKLGLDNTHLTGCLKVLVAKDEKIVPVYAENTHFQGNEAWIVVIKGFFSARRGFDMKVYVLSIPLCEILYSTD